MFQQWIKNLQPNSTNTTEPDNHWVERLTALLLIEIARSDTNIDEIELNTIRQALQESCKSIDAEEIEQIITTARNDADTAISLRDQIRQINQGFSGEQKLSLVEKMWRVALADGDLDKYEEYMIRQLCGLLHVSHQNFIQTKLKVIES